KGRIIDICILVHDGLTVVDKFSTLINPYCYISPFFTKLSGITNEMVADAPKFHEVAKQIIDITEGKVFIAHNVGFDYGFVKEEFASLGYVYKRETLCTVRLSRKLIPGKFSYSLGNLCDSLGIVNEARHRAEGDAVATAKLFDILLQLKSTNPVYKNKGVEDLMARRVDKIKQYVLNKIPEACGVYYFLDREGAIIYIGKSVNMYNRAMSHFNTKEKKGKKMLNDLYNVDFIETGSELIALLHESEELKKHKPPYNRVRKEDNFKYSIDWFMDDDGILNLEIVDSEKSKNSLQSFVSYSSARERMDRWIEDNALCLRYCNLTSHDAVCDHHHIKKCYGICAGREDTESYNQRGNKILKQFEFPHPEFIIFDRGRTTEERSVILIENGKYCGYGYIDHSHQFSHPAELKDIINRTAWYPDANDLVRSFIRINEGKIKVVEIS
ncbi:MAG: exonuclease domain-containing protein, partial [Bacteroidia bacterium]